MERGRSLGCADEGPFSIGAEDAQGHGQVCVCFVYGHVGVVADRFIRNGDVVKIRTAEGDSPNIQDNHVADAFIGSTSSPSSFPELEDTVRTD